MVRRGVVQILSALLHNANLPGFITGRIWQAQPKSVCVPVLNCYSCPGALGACPIGSLQSTLASTALKFPFYVVGLLLLFALCLGRVICGWLCPFGLVQDLLYKIPSPKLRKNAFTQKLSLLKYAVAVIFVLLLPVYFWWQDGVGAPAFCKYICPVTVFLKPTSYFSLLRVKCDEEKCVSCGKCRKVCPMNVNPSANSRKRENATECILCLRCVEECPKKALKL